MLNVNYRNHTFELDKKKVIFVLSKLEGKQLKSLSDSELLKMMRKYKLIQYAFLENINSI